MDLYFMEIKIHSPNHISDSVNNKYFVDSKDMELIHSILGKISQHIYYYNCHLIWQCIKQQDNTVFNLSADFD